MNEDIGKVGSKLASLLRDSVSRACGTSGTVGVLFSGGVDSSVVAKLASEKSRVLLYCAGAAEGSEDAEFAAKAAALLNLRIRTAIFSPDDVRGAMGGLAGKIGTADRMQLGIALPVYFATRLAMEDGLIKFALCGGGADELFGGYSRYLKVPTAKLNDVLRSDIAAMREKDLKRDSAASFIEIRYPYLDPEVVDFSLSIRAGMKIAGGERKIVLREAGRQLGLPPEITGRKKKACQYGSGADKLLKGLMRKKKDSE